MATVYADSGDVTARLPTPPLNATSQPSTTNITEWIEDAEGELHGVLARCQITTPVTNANGILKAKNAVLLFAEGHTRMARAAAGGDGDNDDGKDLITRWDELLEAMRGDCVGTAAEFQGGDAGDSSRRMRSHVTDHPDGQSVVAGDFAPEFTKRDGSDQL